MHPYVRLRGARTNNLKNIDVNIPLKKMTVITGLSGSGKSSLAFDTLYAEGQRRYVESLSTYVRQFLEKMPRPDIDGLDNISPAIALEQKNHINNSRSTVASMSELYDYLRLLFGKIGVMHCMTCNKPVSKDSPISVARGLSAMAPSERFYVLAPLDASNLMDDGFELTKKSLIADGFSRLFINDEIYEIAELNELPHQAPSKPSAGKKTKKAKGKSPAPIIQNVYLVIDRMSVPKNPASDGRLLDAFEQAMIRGNGRFSLAFPPADKKSWALYHYSDKLTCCGVIYKTPDPQMLSFNSPLGACPTCKGFGFTLELSENKIVPIKKKTLRAGAIDPFTKPAYADAQTALIRFCEKNAIPTDKRYEDLSAEQKKILWKGAPGTKTWFNGIDSFFDGLKEMKYKMYVRIFVRRYQEPSLCLACNGSRLRPESLNIKIAQHSIADILRFSIRDARQWGTQLNLTKSHAEIASDVMKQVASRLTFLDEVGVGYLSLDRLGKTLSGGECQRIYLASQLGNKLCSTLYVLDEPSIGLHPADTERLVRLLHELRDLGNTVVVVEHDLDIIRCADHIVELGPAAGAKGGALVADGPLDSVVNGKGPKGLTAKYLSNELKISPRIKIRPPAKDFIKITGASAHNLKDVTVEIPLKRLVCATGLSGSGKTTLIHKTLYNALDKLFHQENTEVGRFHRMYGADLIDDVVLLDQTPIGRSSRSNPATYLKMYDDIRKIYANQSISLRRGYSPKFFSFNVDGGRCPTCSGEGEVTIDMHFMAEITLPCEECNGKRFKKDILDVEFKKKNISQLLSTTIDECIDLFREYPSVNIKLQILKQVGLGYIQLGQSSTTLSGGESQRLKVASVLAQANKNHVLYIFDEPTTGLHIDDVRRLVDVMQGLVDSGHSVLVIEHNLDFIAMADHIIDLGPGAGEDGGQIVATGTPQELAHNPHSITGRFLKSGGRF